MSRSQRATVLILCLGLTTTPGLAANEWQSVEKALGVSGSMQPDGVYKVSLPRSDLKVLGDGIEIKPAFALGSWLAFKQENGGATVMGDLVLTEEEVNPVLAALEEHGIEVTALHHHLNNLSPDILYMHVHGTGDAGGLAAALRAALQESATPLSSASGQEGLQQLDLDTAALDRIIGYEGKADGGVYHYGIPRADEVTNAGMAVPPSMGTATALNFQPTGDGKAAITGDFVMAASEVNPVVRALRDQGITVMALHNHMLTEQPRLFFMHFWANDDAARLAQGLRSAIDQMKVAEP